MPELRRPADARHRAPSRGARAPDVPIRQYVLVTALGDGRAPRGPRRGAVGSRPRLCREHRRRHPVPSRRQAPLRMRRLRSALYQGAVRLSAPSCARARRRVRRARGRHPHFIEDTAPTPAELRAIEDRVEARFGGWLKRNGFLDEEGPEEQALDGWWTEAARAPSGVLAPVGPRRSSRWEVDARVRVAAGDEKGRLQLCLYVARPPFAEAQLEVVDEDRRAPDLPQPDAQRTTRRSSSSTRSP